MGVKFDYQTLDIFVALTAQEADSLKRTSSATPVLEFQAKDAHFYLMNPKSKEFITVIPPRTPAGRIYWIKINDEAYRYLLRIGHIGDIYDGEHKIDIRIDS